MTGRFGAALAAYQRARDAFELLPDTVPDATAFRVAAEHAQAMASMLRCPAPDRDALRAKLAVLHQEDCADSARLADWLTAVTRDAKALQGGAHG